jgi:hypothetical protein
MASCGVCGKEVDDGDVSVWGGRFEVGEVFRKWTKKRVEVGRNLLIFLMKIKIEKMSKIILKQCCLIICLLVRKQ